MNKRSVSIVGAVTAALTLAASMPVSFAAETDYEKLVLDVKNRIGVPEEYTEFSTSGRYESDGRTMYSFTWTTKDEEDRKYIDVTCRDDGFITSYHSGGGDHGMYDSLTMDEVKAEDAARDFIASADPELSGIAKLERENGYSYGGITYSISAEFYGIGYYRAIGSITVDADNGINNMNVTLPEVAEPDAAAKYLGADDGVAAYRDKVGVKTVYRTYRDDEGALAVFPAYVSIDDKAVDAVTGEITEIGSEKPKVFGVNEAASSADAGSGGGGYRELNESEKAEIAALNGLISESDAAALINERLGTALTVENTSLYNDSEERYYYSLYGEEGSFTVDAQNGDILSAYITIEPDESDTTALSGYSFDDAASAKQLLEVLAPSSGAAYEYDEDSADMYKDPETDISYSGFVYKVNGIEVEGVDAAVRRSVDNGRTSYSISISPVEVYAGLDYASPDTFADIDTLVFSDGSYVSLKYAETPDGIKPVYISEQYMKNAVTGADVDYRGEEYEPDGITYSDIEGHWVQYAAEKLAGSGIGFKDGELRPDEPAMAEDAEELLYEIYGDNGAVSEVNDGSAPVTRLEAAKMLIKCEGLEELAAMDIYSQPYTDITEDYGITAILKGYGVIDGSASEFRPDDSLTRAELLQMIYNALVSFNG